MAMRSKRHKGVAQDDTVPTEHKEQVVFMERVAWMLPDYAQVIYAVPNGGHRHPKTAARLKVEGVKRGVLDIIVDVPRGPYHGLRIELKRVKGGVVSREQTAMMDALRSMGYRAECCAGANAAWRVLCDYLGVCRRTGRVEL